MEKYRINGGLPLYGAVDISGAKNAVVAILPAVILSDEPCRIENIPNINDVSTSLRILRSLGAEVNRLDRHTVQIDPRPICTDRVDYELARTMRASYYFIGALLGKRGSARVPMPGGCWFGVRPIDLHLKGFHALGAQALPMEQGIIEVHAEQLTGNSVYLDTVSVGATVNIMLAAARARGMTVIENAAKEPHIVDLANFLNTMGARITGAGTDTVKIRGVNALRGGTYAIIPDQIEAGTYLAAVTAVGGNVLVQNVIPKHMECITSKLQEMGAKVINYDDSIRIMRTGKLRQTTVKTRPYPGFPTDMQAQVCVCMALAGGTSRLTESVYETRFFGYCTELESMGASIRISGKTATVTGVDHLTGSTVFAHDLRAGAALVIAGLAARGTTFVEHIHFIERGYENLVEKLRALGADICRVEDEC